MDGMASERSDDLRSLRNVAFRLYVGCPVRCGHCHISAPTSVPVRGSVTVGDVLALVNHPRLREAAFWMTGSEVLIGDTDFLEIGQQIGANGQPLGVITSGYWACGDHQAKRGVDYLDACCVATIRISVDPFHQEDVSLSRARRIIAHARRLKKQILISETVAPGEKSNADHYAETLGIGREQVSSFAMSASGRGLRVPTGVNRVPFVTCDAGSAVYLDTDGTLFPCTGPGGVDTLRTVGHVRDGVVSISSHKYRRVVSALSRSGLMESEGTLDACGTCSRVLRAMNGISSL